MASRRGASAGTRALTRLAAVAALQDEPREMPSTKVRPPWLARGTAGVHLDDFRSAFGSVCSCRLPVEVTDGTPSSRKVPTFRPFRPVDCFGALGIAVRYRLNSDMALLWHAMWPAPRIAVPRGA